MALRERFQREAPSVLLQKALKGKMMFKSPIDYKKAVLPNDILSFAQLLKRWPYKTTERVTYHSCDIVDSRHAPYPESNLNMYMFKKVLKGPNKEVYLDLELGLLKKDNFDFYCEHCGDIFFLKEEIEYIENKNQGYVFEPDIKDIEDGEIICNDSNLPRIAKMTLYSIAHYTPGRQPLFPEDFQLQSDRLFPWLGPIAPDFSKFGSASCKKKDIDETYVANFVEAAKQLGQDNDNILAQMLAYRFPQLTWEQLAQHVAQERDTAPKKTKETRTAAEKQAIETWKKRGRILLGKK